MGEPMNNFRQDIIYTLIQKGAITAAEIARLNDYHVETVWDELQELKLDGVVRERVSAEFLWLPEDDELEERRVMKMARRLGCEPECLSTWFVYCGGPISRAFVEIERMVS